MKKVLFLILILSNIHGRDRGVALEWNSDAVCLEDDWGKLISVGGWHYSPWIGAYFQTCDFWVYHCDKGWLLPESDGNQGVWFYWGKTDSWVWTRRDIYPFAWDSFTENWMDFCVKPSADAG